MILFISILLIWKQEHLKESYTWKRPFKPNIQSAVYEYTSESALNVFHAITYMLLLTV